MARGNKRQGSYLLATGALIVGVAICFACVIVNLQFGYAMALTDAGQTTQAMWSVLIDAGFGICAAVTGFLLRGHRWISGALVGIVTLIAGSFTVVSTVGYFANERIGKFNLKVAEAQAEQKAKRGSRPPASTTALALSQRTTNSQNQVRLNSERCSKAWGSRRRGGNKVCFTYSRHTALHRPSRLDLSYLCNRVFVVFFFAH